MKNKTLLIAKIIIFAIAILTLVTMCTGCGFERDSEVASYNVSKEADSFRVKRRVTFINLRSNEYLFSIVGNCSIDDNSSNELEVICKIGDSSYQKHFLYLCSRAIEL